MARVGRPVNGLYKQCGGLALSHRSSVCVDGLVKATTISKQGT